MPFALSPSLNSAIYIACGMAPGPEHPQNRPRKRELQDFLNGLHIVNLDFPQ